MIEEHAPQGAVRTSPLREERGFFMTEDSRTRDLFIRLVSREGFRTLQTNEPNGMLPPENLLMARIGESVPPDLIQRFKLVRFSLNPDR